MDPAVIKILDNIQEKLTDQDEPFECGDIKITYKNYLDIVDGLTAKAINIQKTLPVLLKQIDDECKIPSKISNLTRKVRKFVKNNPEKLNCLVPDLLVSDNILHSDFQRMENDLGNLLNGETFKTTPDFELKNEHILNLRRIVVLRSVPWKTAAKWVADILGSKCVNPHSIRSQWNRLYEAKKKLRLLPSDYALFCNELYKSPTVKPPADSCHQKEQSHVQSVANETVHHQVDGRTAEVLRSMYNKLVDLSEKMTSLTKENKLLNEKLIIMNDLKQQYNKQMKEINTLKMKLTECNPRNTVRKIKRRDNKLDKLQIKLNRKEQQLEVKNKELDTQQEQIEQLEKELTLLRNEKLNLQKVKSYYKQKLGKDPKHENIKQMKDQIKSLVTENDSLKAQLEEAMKDHQKLNLFQNGKYNDAIRLVYIDLLQMGVSIKNCQNAVKTVLSNLVDVEVDRLPKKTLATLLTVEAQILAQAQAAEEILNVENVTLHLDGTKKHFEEYAGFQVSVGDGRSFSLGHQLMTSGDTISYIEATKETVEELACSLSTDGEERKKIVANIIMKMRNIMTDRHVVNKCYQNSFENLRKKYGEEVIENWDQLTEEQKGETVKVNGLFCGLHILVNMASASLKGLLKFEEQNEIVNSYNQQSAASELVRASAKAFMVTSGDEKSGDAAEFKYFLDSLNQKMHFITFKHNRFNVLFHDAGAMYFHYKHITDYLSSGRTNKCNKLLSAILKGCENDKILSECRALGLVGKVLCGPLWRLLEKPETHFFQMNEHWLQLKIFLEQFTTHPEDLLKGNVTFRGATIEKDEVFEKLVKPNDKFDKFTLEAITSLCQAMIPVVTRQLEDQLPGGKYHLPTPELVRQTSTTPLTNRLSEADFSDLDRSISQAPQKGKASRSGTICFKRNKTQQYLKALSKSKRDKYMNIARKLAKDRAAQDGIKTKSVRKERLLLQAKRIEKKELRKQNKADKENNIKSTLDVEGVWTTEDDVHRNIDGLSKTKQIKKLRTQILGHRLVLKSTISDSSLFSWTKNKQSLTVDELKQNLIKIIQTAFRDNIPGIVSSINNNLITPAMKSTAPTVREKVSNKRPGSKTKSTVAKKIKTSPKIVKFNVGTFYAVAFQQQWYPGECIEVKNDQEATIKYLLPKGSFFQWPARDDIMDTNIKAVLCETQITPVCGGRLWNVSNKPEIIKLFQHH